jgi:hypothetical protein
MTRIGRFAVVASCIGALTFIGGTRHRSGEGLGVVDDQRSTGGGGHDDDDDHSGGGGGGGGGATTTITTRTTITSRRDLIDHVDHDNTTTTTTTTVAPPHVDDSDVDHPADHVVVDHDVDDARTDRRSSRRPRPRHRRRRGAPTTTGDTGSGTPTPNGTGPTTTSAWCTTTARQRRHDGPATAISPALTAILRRRPGAGGRTTGVSVSTRHGQHSRSPQAEHSFDDRATLRK